MAVKMLACLPARVPAPEMDYDMDGETSLEWQRPGNNAVSVSVRANGKLCVAWMSDQYGHSHGSAVMEFTGQWPKVLVDIIRLIFPVRPE